jgi:hypothetical protein
LLDFCVVYLEEVVEPREEVSPRPRHGGWCYKIIKENGGLF